MDQQSQSMQAGKFKAECLHIMDEVKESGKEVVITKRGVPVVKLCPIEPQNRCLFGIMQGTVKVLEDIIAPLEEEWHAAR